MRRIIIAAYLLVLAFAVCAFGDVQVYSDTDSLGVVPSLMEGSRLFVSAEDVGKIFGFTARKNGEQLLLTKGNSQLRFMLNSAAAWRGTSICTQHRSSATAKFGWTLRVQHHCFRLLQGKARIISCGSRMQH